MIDTKTACAVLSVTSQTIRNYCRRGMPHYRGANGRPQFIESEILEWCREHLRRS